MRRLTRWWRRRRFIKAYRILQRESQRHINADHLMEFEAVNESMVLMRCVGCPNLQP